MSTVHTFKPKTPIAAEDFLKDISYGDELHIRPLQNNEFHFWIQSYSTRGVYLRFGKNKVLITNNFLSIATDYELTNFLVARLLESTTGVLKNEENELVKELPLYSQEMIAAYQNQACNTLQLLTVKGHDVAVFGPIRPVHFGPNWAERFQSSTGQELENVVFNTILHVNYNLPDFNQGLLREIKTETGETKSLQILDNSEGVVISKFDFIGLIDGTEEKLILITNKILNDILPFDWHLIDEYTVAAPQLEEDEWQELLRDAIPHHCNII